MVGIGGTGRTAGGMLLSSATGHILEWTHSYVPNFILAASVYLLAFGIIHLMVPRLEPVKLCRQITKGKPCRSRFCGHGSPGSGPGRTGTHLLPCGSRPPACHGCDAGRGPVPALVPQLFSPRTGGRPHGIRHSIPGSGVGSSGVGRSILESLSSRRTNAPKGSFLSPTPPSGLPFGILPVWRKKAGNVLPALQFNHGEPIQVCNAGKGDFPAIGDQPTQCRGSCGRLRPRIVYDCCGFNA